MFHTDTSKQNVLHRLRIARGHLEKVMTMVEADAYCIDVLTQSRAVRKALHKAELKLLEHHLSHCVVDHIEHGRADQATQEVLSIFAQEE